MSFISHERHSLSGMLERTSEAAPPTTEFRLRLLERELEVKLPPDYRSFLLKHNGGRPIPACFLLRLNRDFARWRIHFFFGVEHPIEVCSLRWNANVTQTTRPPGTIPIASDEGGNLLYLRWAEPHKGAIFFGATPSDGRRVELVWICQSFSELLSQLFEPESS